MSDALYFISDASGSMCEWGKKDILKLALQILSTKFADCPGAHFCFWGKDVADRADGAKPAFSGSSNTDALCAFLSSLPQDSAVLLLSDGLFAGDAVNALISAAGSRNLKVFTAAIGADADLQTLTKLSSFKRVYTVSELPGTADRLRRCLRKETAL